MLLFHHYYVAFSHRKVVGIAEEETWAPASSCYDTQARGKVGQGGEKTAELAVQRARAVKAVSTFLPHPSAQVN